MVKITFPQTDYSAILPTGKLMKFIVSNNFRKICMCINFCEYTMKDFAIIDLTLRLRYIHALHSSRSPDLGWDFNIMDIQEYR